MKEVLKLKGENIAQHTDITSSSSSSTTTTTTKVNSNSITTAQILSRMIPNSVLRIYSEKIKNLNTDLNQYFKEECMKCNIDKLQIEAEHAENLLIYDKEIESRPMRTWYQSEYQKKEIQLISKDYVKIEQNIAKYGKNDAEIIMKSASERAKALASIDDYPLDKNEKNKLHKLSRKKRRRLEAMKQLEDNDDDDNNNKDSNKNNEKHNSKG